MGDPTHEEPAYCGLSDGLLRLLATFAQTPASVTATCKDCSSFSGTTRSGACRGHGGVRSWGTAPAATTPAPAPSTPSPGSAAAAAGGGPGQVWVNTVSNVYHCHDPRHAAVLAIASDLKTRGQCAAPFGRLGRSIVACRPTVRPWSARTLWRFLLRCQFGTLTQAVK